jgi:hypothetical protein
LRSTIALIDRLVSEVGAPKSNLDLVLTNGRQLYALRRGSPMVYVERDRLSSPETEQGKTPRPVTPVRYVLVANVAENNQPQDYRAMDDAQLISIDRDLKVTAYSL